MDTSAFIAAGLYDPEADEADVRLAVLTFLTEEVGASIPEIVRALGSPGVRLMSDTFHMNIEEPNLPETIRACGDAIGHVHLADSTRKEPGSGGADFGAIFAALRDIGFTGYMAFECGLTGPADEVLPRSVAYLREQMG